MSDTTRHDRLIGELAATLRPVRRLPPPWKRAAGWVVLVVAIGVGLLALAGSDIVRHRLAANPDAWLAVLGSALTAPLAAYAAFQTSVPGRNPRWALLPVPAALLWVGASGFGCLRSWIAPPSRDAVEPRDCLVFIVCVSLPLAIALVLMLRRACPLRPGLTATLGGLASAAAAATLLNLFHPFDVAATDLAIHAVAIALVVLATRALGARALGSRTT
ncbi:MAG TPA: NrsF family protein [Acetobacteraceae bacterium]|nr:NrsF family protein [Acetobacteraceae bacterium]